MSSHIYLAAAAGPVHRYGQLLRRLCLLAALGLLSLRALPAAATTYDFYTPFGMDGWEQSTVSGNYEDLLITVTDNDLNYPMPYASAGSGTLSFAGEGWSYSSANVLLTIAKTNGSSFTPNSVRLIYHTYSANNIPGTYQGGTINILAFSGATQVGSWSYYYDGANDGSGLVTNVDFSQLSGFGDITSLQFDNDRQDLSLQALVMDSAPANVAPTFVGSTTNLNISQNDGATNINHLLLVSDTDASQTITWSEASAPAHGTLSFSNSATASGGTNLSPDGAITYVPDTNYVGADTFAVQVSDGVATNTRTLLVSVADHTAPTVVSILRQTPSTQTVTNTTVVFAATFSENVLGVVPARFAVTPVNGGTSTGTVSSVTGGPQIYDVTVNITGGRGEFRLDVIPYAPN